MASIVWDLRLTLLAIGMLLASVAGDRTFEAGDVMVTIDENSGTLKLKSRSGGERSAVEVGLGDILEVNPDGKQVATTGNVEQQHLVKRYDDILFTVSDLTDTKVNGKAAKMVAHEARLPFGPKLKVTTLIFTEDGDVTFGYTFPVRVNDIRVHFALEGWKFCDTTSNPCHNTSDVGNLLDFFISVDGAEVAEALDSTAMCLRRARVGEATLCLPSKVRTNNVWTDQKSGYPKSKPRKDNKDQFVFCFYRPEDTYKADFLFDMGMRLTSGAFGHVASVTAPLTLVFFVYIFQ